MLQGYRALGKYASRFNVIVAQLPWEATETSVFTDASPAVANGDMSAVTYTDPGSFEVDLTSTGVVVIDTSGSLARQSFYCDVYDVSLRQWMGDTLEWVNNSLPVYDGTLGVTTVQEGTAVTLSVGSAVTDPNGDGLTYTIISGALPPGLTMDAAGNITGTP